MAKILIVDDSALSRRLLRKILEEAGHAVSEAEEGLAALERYFLEKPDLILLDLTMQGMYGMDVLVKLREMDPEARVVVATADIQRSTRQMAEAAGARSFLGKPFVAEEVHRAVAEALGESQP